MKDNVFYYFYNILLFLGVYEFLVILELVTLLSTQKEAEVDVSIVLFDTSLLHFFLKKS